MECPVRKSSAGMIRIMSGVCGQVARTDQHHCPDLMVQVIMEENAHGCRKYILRYLKIGCHLSNLLISNGSRRSVLKLDCFCSVSLRLLRIFKSIIQSKSPSSGQDLPSSQLVCFFLSEESDKGRACASLPFHASTGGLSGSHSGHLLRPWTPSFSQNASGGGSLRCQGCREEG